MNSHLRDWTNGHPVQCRGHRQFSAGIANNLDNVAVLRSLVERFVAIFDLSRLSHDHDGDQVIVFLVVLDSLADLSCMDITCVAL